MSQFLSKHTAVRPTRRWFLVGAGVTTGGLAVGYRPVLAAPDIAQTTPAKVPANPFQTYVEITKENRIIIHSSQFEMGQGSYFGIATLVMEELDGDWAQVDVVGGYGNTAFYGNLAWGGAAQATGGSTSMGSSWERYRKAGAAARALLVAAAAQRWDVPAGEIKVASGVVSHASGMQARYGDLAEAAAGMPVPDDVPLKPRDKWAQIGSDSLKRYDSASKTNGAQTYTIDLMMEGLQTAVMIHPPKFGA